MIRSIRSFGESRRNGICAYLSLFSLLDERRCASVEKAEGQEDKKHTFDKK